MCIRDSLDIINRTFCSCSYCLFTSLRFGIIPFDLLLLNLFFQLLLLLMGCSLCLFLFLSFKSASFSGCPLFPASGTSLFQPVNTFAAFF